jgi:hypothetical protein
MKRQWIPMTYDRDGERWVVHLEGRTVGFQCGEWLLMRIGESTEIPCRIEMDREWYVIMGDAKFYLRKNDTYQVEI